LVGAIARSISSGSVRGKPADAHHRAMVGASSDVILLPAARGGNGDALEQM